MTTLEANALHQALVERRELVANEASRRDQAAHIERLEAASVKIELLEKNLTAPIPPQLAHFLERKSYDKAMSLLALQTTSQATKIA